MKLEDYSKAMEVALKVLALDETNIKALYHAGVAKMRLNDLDKAMQYLKKAETQSPGQMEIKKALSELKERQMAEKKVRNETEEKMFKGKLPLTVCKLTPAGKKALSQYRQQLQDFIQKTSSA